MSENQNIISQWKLSARALTASKVIAGSIIIAAALGACIAIVAGGPLTPGMGAAIGAAAGCVCSALIAFSFRPAPKLES